VAGKIVMNPAFRVSPSSVPQLSRDGLADSVFVWDKISVACATIEERLCALSSIILTIR
jgi:hypothetical protein